MMIIRYHHMISHHLIITDLPQLISLVKEKKRDIYIYIIYGEIMNPKATLHLTTCPPNLHKGMVMYINYTTKWYDKLCYKHLYTQ